MVHDAYSCPLDTGVTLFCSAALFCLSVVVIHGKLQQNKRS